MTCPFELINQLERHNISVFLQDNRVKVSLPETIPEEVKPLLSELKNKKREVITYLTQLEILRQARAKQLHQLFITTLAEIAKYKFTDTPLTWAKEHNCKHISWEMFKAETNLNGAVLDGNLEEAKYWANKPNWFTAAR